jgi:hypothetical protein
MKSIHEVTKKGRESGPLAIQVLGPSIWAHCSDARRFRDFGYRESRAWRKLSSKVAKSHWRLHKCYPPKNLSGLRLSGVEEEAILQSEVAKKGRESGLLAIQVFDTVDLGPLFRCEKVSGLRLSGVQSMEAAILQGREIAILI